MSSSISCTCCHHAPVGHRKTRFPHIPRMSNCCRACTTRYRQQYHFLKPKVWSSLDSTVPAGKNPPPRLESNTFKATEEDLCTYLFIRLMTLTSLGHGTDGQSLSNPATSQAKMRRFHSRRSSTSARDGMSLYDSYHWENDDAMP